MSRIISIAVIASAMLILKSAGFAQGHSKEETGTRSVQGIVKDSSGKPIANAAVLLKDTKSLQIRSFRTLADGSYHFAGLNPNVEYRLQADYEGVRSGWKTLSIFNTKKIANIDLKLKK